MKRRTFFRGLGAAAFYREFLGAGRAQGTSAVPTLKIREIRAVRLRGLNNRFVRVYTDQGLTGTGEFLDTLGAEYIINDNISAALAGRDPLDVEGLLSTLWQDKLPGSAPSAVFVRGLGGPYLTAVSGVEMALWDLAGKAMGVPLYRLFGGRVRDRIPVYLHAVDAAEAKTLIAQTKVPGLKIGIDYKPWTATIRKGTEPDKSSGLHLNNPQMDDIAALVASVREATGPGYNLMLECHTRFDTESAIQLCRLLEPYRLTWVEEPIPPDNPDAMARIRSQTRVPIAAGENIYTRYGYRPFLEKEALSVIQPDMCKTGGLLEGRKIAAMAEVYYVPVAPHGVASPLGTMAYAHVSADIPNLLMLEWTHYLNQSITALTEPVKLEDGYLTPAGKPGIGVALNEDAVKERLDAGFRPL
ncbi:MAG TPA: mandelate racemase/muconate lactonizing enzyme family protein [Bryobacteraceae bacterium]|nr:mandelate racemase/muconate lactonizing enzyme family protein [Bryobacteraceae bacterium]